MALNRRKDFLLHLTRALFENLHVFCSFKIMRVLTFTIIKTENDPALKDNWIARCKDNFLLILKNISITAGNPTYR